MTGGFLQGHSYEMIQYDKTYWIKCHTSLITRMNGSDSKFKRFLNTEGLIGFVFFFCLFIAGLTSSISMLESFATAALNKFKIGRDKLVTIISLFGFVGSFCFASYAGFNYILDIVDAYVGNIVIAGIGLIEVVLISYLYGTEELRQQANEFSDFKVDKWWDFLLKYFTPLLLGAVVVTNIIGMFRGLLSMDTVSVILQAVFDWGTVLIMIGASIVFYKRKWTTGVNNNSR